MRVSHGLLSLCSVSTAQCTMVSQKRSTLRPFHPMKPAPCSTVVPRGCRMQQAKPHGHPIIHPKHVKALGMKSGLKARNKKRAYSHSPPQQLLKSISLPSLEPPGLVLAPKFSSYKGTLGDFYSSPAFHPTNSSETKLPFPGRQAQTQQQEQLRSSPRQISSHNPFPCRGRSSDLPR